MQLSFRRSLKTIPLSGGHLLITSRLNTLTTNGLLKQTSVSITNINQTAFSSHVSHATCHCSSSFDTRDLLLDHWSQTSGLLFDT